MNGRNTPERLVVRQAEEILRSMNDQIAKVSLEHAMIHGQLGLMDDLEFGRYPCQMIDGRSLATLDGIQPGLGEFILDEAERRQDQARVETRQPANHPTIGQRLCRLLGHVAFNRYGYPYYTWGK